MEHKTDEDGLPSLQLKLALKPTRPLPVGYSIAFSSLSLKVSCRAFVSVRGIAARLARTVESETATRAGALVGNGRCGLALPDVCRLLGRRRSRDTNRVCFCGSHERRTLFCLWVQVRLSPESTCPSQAYNFDWATALNKVSVAATPLASQLTIQIQQPPPPVTAQPAVAAASIAAYTPPNGPRAGGTTAFDQCTAVCVGMLPRGARSTDFGGRYLGDGYRADVSVRPIACSHRRKRVPRTSVR